MASFSVFKIRSEYGRKFLVFLTFVLFFYCEFVSYWTLPWTWLEQPNCQAPDCKKILLVSDPQIIGSEWKRFLLLDILAIWDSDRYLKRTFHEAVNYLEPDLVVFLGDLMDQGHTATDSEFKSYMRRLSYLFELPKKLKNTKVIISPGDNDIGGVEDILIPVNVERFNKLFNQSEECELIDLIEFCKVNLMTLVIQESKFITSDTVRVALSHLPLTPVDSTLLKEIVKKIRPNLIFSGHDHTSSHYSAYEYDVWSYKNSSITPRDKSSKIYKFHEGLFHEIVVPTCSYRMGVYNMGYGAAFLDIKKQLVYYNVLWLPHRYRQMVIYMVTVVPVVLSLVVMSFKRGRGFRQQYLDSPPATPAAL